MEASQKLVEVFEYCPTVKMLVTTRTPLHLRGEKEYPIHPLPLPSLEEFISLDLQKLSQYAAIVLFIERARNVKPSFQATPANIAAITSICSHLDGLPLAIELAASRMKYLTPQALLSHISKSLKILTSGSRDLPARQQTLYNLISWSYELLSKDEKLLFQRLSIFTGGCTLETAEVVCTTYSLQPLDSDILDGIGGLVDKSLLVCLDGEQDRFVMLQTIREFGLTQLTQNPEYAILRNAYVEYYLSLAEQAEAHLTSADQQEWLDLLETELNNFYTIFSWCLEDRAPLVGLRVAAAAWRFWAMRGYLSAGLNILEALLALPYIPMKEEHVRASALYAAGSLAIKKGNYTKAGQWLMESLALSNMFHNELLAARVLNSLAITESYQQRFDKAALHFEESLALHRKTEYQHGIASALLNLGEVAYYQNQLAQAKQYTVQAQQILRREGDNALVAITLINLASIARKEETFSSALLLAREALLLQQQLHDQGGIAETLECLGKIFAVQKQSIAARMLGAASYLREMLDIPLSPSEAMDIEQTLPPSYMQSAIWQETYASGRSAKLDEILQAALSVDSS